VSDGGLTIRGTWSDRAGTRELPFFLGPVQSSAAFETYYRAMLKTPGRAHVCGAYVRAASSVPAPLGRELVSYVLSWPCEGPSGMAFVAQAEPRAPERFLGAPLFFGELDGTTEFTIEALPGGLGKLAVYQVSAEQRDEAGPNSFRCCWASSETRRWLLPVSQQAKLGAVVALAKTTSASGVGSCLNHSAFFEFAAIELDAHRGPELVVTLHESGEKSVPAPSGAGTLGGIVCVAAPPKLTRSVFRVDERPTRLVRMQVPAQRLDQALRTLTP
jgi:hypothetical protein